MNSNNMRKLALGLLVGTATQLVAVPAFADSQLDRLERMLDARNQMMLDMQRQLDQISTDVDDLRGKVERNSYDLKQMLERQRELYREVDTLSSQQAQQAKRPKQPIRMQKKIKRATAAILMKTKRMRKPLI